MPLLIDPVRPKPVEALFEPVRPFSPREPIQKERVLEKVPKIPYRSDAEEIRAELMRSRIRQARWTSQAAGYRVGAEKVYGKDFLDQVSAWRPWYPKEYEHIRLIDGKWINEYDEELPEPPPTWTHPDVSKTLPQKAGEMVLGPKLGRPDLWVPRLLMGSPSEKAEVMGELMEDLFWGTTNTIGPDGDRKLLDPLAPGWLMFWTRGLTKGLKGLEKTRLVQQLVEQGMPKEVAIGEAAKSMALQIHQRRAEARQVLKNLKEGGGWAPRLIWNALNDLKKPLEPLGVELHGWMAPPLEGLWEILSAPAKWHVFPNIGEGRKSLQEIFQPAVERLAQDPRRLDRPFRQAGTQKAMVLNFATRMGEEVANMNIKQRHAFQKSILQVGPSTKSFRKVEKLVGLGRNIKPSFRQEYAKQVRRAFLSTSRKGSKSPVGVHTWDAAKPLDRSEMLGKMEDLDKFVLDISKETSGNADPAKLHKLLGKAIDNPDLPFDVRRYARDLYNQPLDTPLAIADASHFSSKRFLANTLKEMGVTKPVLMPDDNPQEFLKSSFPGLEDLFLPRDVELELRSLETIPKIAHKAWNKWFLTPWKTNKVILRPATHFRNIFSNAILNDWGGLPFWRGDIYARAWKEVRGKGKYWKEWEKITGGGGTFTLSDIEQVTRGYRHGANIFDIGLAHYDRYTKKARDLYNFEEQWFKMAKFIHNREKGLDPEEAALDAMKYTFNYGEITRFTARMRGSAAPFFTWQSKVLPLMAETAVKHPVRFMKWPILGWYLQQKAIERLGMTEREWEWTESVLPKYVQEGQFLLVPWRDPKGRLQFLNLTYMIPGLGDIGEMYMNPSGWMLGHPLMGIGSALLTKTKFGGAPLYYEWEEPGVKFMKSMVYAWQQWAPNLPVMPGAIDWYHMWDMINERPEALTWDQVLASQVGLKVVAINPVVQARKKRALEDIHRSQIANQMRREMRDATSNRERKAIIDRYMKLRREVGF